MEKTPPTPKMKDGKMARLALLDFGWMGVCRSILFCPRLYTYKYYISSYSPAAMSDYEE